MSSPMVSIASACNLDWWQGRARAHEVVQLQLLSRVDILQAYLNLVMTETSHNSLATLLVMPP
jgi:hypothetical protein